MYLRRTTRRKDGKVHRCWQLVRSVRIGRKVVQQTAAHLGELDGHGRARAQALARAITGDRDQPDLFLEDHADEAIPVRLKRIRLERGRQCHPPREFAAQWQSNQTLNLETVYFFGAGPVQ